MKNVILRSPFTALRVDSGDEESRKCLILRTLIFFAEFTLSQMKRILRYAQDDSAALRMTSAGGLFRSLLSLPPGTIS